MDCVWVVECVGVWQGSRFMVYDSLLRPFDAAPVFADLLRPAPNTLVAGLRRSGRYAVALRRCSEQAGRDIISSGLPRPRKAPIRHSSWPRLAGYEGQVVGQVEFSVQEGTGHSSNHHSAIPPIIPIPQSRNPPTCLPSRSLWRRLVLRSPAPNALGAGRSTDPPNPSSGVSRNTAGGSSEGIPGACAPCIASA
jgi:hypothetical protein